MKLKKTITAILALLLLSVFAMPAFAGNANFNKEIEWGPSQSVASNLAVTKTQISFTLYVLSFYNLKGEKCVEFRGYYNGNACTDKAKFTSTGTITKGYMVSVPMNGLVSVVASIPDKKPDPITIPPIPRAYAYVQGNINN